MLTFLQKLAIDSHKCIFNMFLYLQVLVQEIEYLFGIMLMKLFKLIGNVSLIFFLITFLNEYLNNN